MVMDVKTNPGYQVMVGRGLLKEAGTWIRGLEKVKARKQPGKILMISDSEVFPLYGEDLEKSLEGAGFQVSSFVFPAGEASKTLETVSRIYRQLGEQGFTRSDLVVNLGGGVAGDMGGFAAATFLRGISYVQIPTSLLAQVDAGIGGKTGVDLPFGKNLVGAFHQPSLVLIDPDTLETLPKRQFANGMGEVIKYGCIADHALFQKLRGQETKPAKSSGQRGKGFAEGRRVPEEMVGVMADCVRCKVRLVEEDTRDTGRRMILNFGHTFGHAIEKLQGFTGLLHGEAVGIGMVMAAGLGEKLGVSPAGTEQNIIELLKQYDLPTETSFTLKEIFDATMLDKKSDGSTLHLILLAEMGQAVVYPIERSALERCFAEEI